MSNNKYNASYYISGGIATLALLASGVLAVAPHVQLLAPIATSIAVLNLTLPIIAFCAVFSLLAITLSYKAISKNKAIAEQETQLAEKAKEVKDKDVVISCVNEQLAGKDVVISEMKDQLAKKARKIEAKNKFIINSDVDSQQIHQERRAKKQTSAVEEDGDMYLESLFENISAESAPNVRPVEAPKQIGSGWFSPRQVLGIGIGATFGFAGLLAQCFIGPMLYLVLTALLVMLRIVIILFHHLLILSIHGLY
ncbi:hypothetical protein [Wolbachia endosymbiont (group E) of Neria commutata]|uniref:hypothetical protein n=1 Tax=Wolbachia endosymbiont (group E) of Neria commutata TaxID=3066149 RepID=UPI003132EA82